MEPVAVRTTRDVVTARGPETMAYLQGQLSQDVEAVPVGGAAWSLLLEPNGRALAWLRVVRVADDEVRLDVDGGAGPMVAARLSKFLLRTKSEITVETEVPFVAVRGAEVPGALPSGWPRTSGGDLPGSDVRSAGVPEGGVDELEGLRIAEGVPRTGSEITGREIPGELGGWLVNSSASFTKGCYTGQELVARVDSRGSKVPRHLRVVTGDAIAVGVELVVGEKAVGTVTSVAERWLDGRPIGLALVHRSVEPPVSFDIAGSAVRVLATPAP